MKLIACLILSIFGFSTAQASGSHSQVVIEPQDKSSVTTSTYTYQFKLLDTHSKKYLSDTDIEISHERKVHFLVYDASLDQFQHVHPEFNGQTWSVDLQFAVQGKYFVWTQGKTKQGSEFSTSSLLDVQVGSAALPAPPALSDVRKGADDLSQVALSNTKLKAGKMVMLDMTFSRTDGSKPQLAPYLGAVAHVVAVTSNGNELVHVHPMDGNQPNEAMLHVTFPEAGYYRLWVEFLDGGELKRVPLSVEVK